jgi:hypothetical protein
MKVDTVKIISYSDWDKLVSETYGRIYCFQQQDDCRDRGTYQVTVPSEEIDYPRDCVPEVVNDPEMGVSFEAWLSRDPDLGLSGEEEEDEWDLGLWWGRNFYPHVSMVANDLYKRGRLEEGDYLIKVDW